MTNKLDVLMFTVPHKTRSLNKRTSAKVNWAKDNKYWMQTHLNELSLIYHHFKTGWLIGRERCQTVPLHCCVWFPLVRSGEEQLRDFRGVRLGWKHWGKRLKAGLGEGVLSESLKLEAWKCIRQRESNERHHQVGLWRCMWLYGLFLFI